ncbi:hypothetical protein ABW19_dt0206465 [Dactylella cylindrospora]|nr:hypothetical protein ABW19_dt0206465 [Dactylella cylindrospora]
MASTQVGAFEEALNAFQAKLSPSQRTAFICTTRQDVEALTVTLQEEQKLRTSHTALGLVRPFIDGLSSYAKVIEVFAQTSEILAFVWHWATSCLSLNDAHL